MGVDEESRINKCYLVISELNQKPFKLWEILASYFCSQNDARICELTHTCSPKKWEDPYSYKLNNIFNYIKLVLKL